MNSVAVEELVVRYVGGSNVDGSRINGAAFERPEKDHDGLSVTRRYCLFSADPDDISEIRKIFSSRMTMGKTAVFAEVGVGDILDALKAVAGSFDVVEDPLAQLGTELANPAHALITGLPLKGTIAGNLTSEAVGDLIARKVGKVISAR